MHLIVALLWLAGGWLRIYQQARFFQIEEYMNGRYWHWLLSHPERWGWRRPIFAWTATLLASFLLLRFVTDEWLWLIVYVAAALVAIWPAREKEIKKAFVPTPRAVRLLIATGLLFAAVSLLAAGLVSQVALPEVIVSAYLFMAGLDVVLFLLAPLFLIAGNGLAYPVEAGLRRFYLAKAGSTLRALEPTVIGITGSFGKTSTKHFLTHILNGRYHAIATPKSYNTLMGVSLAINTLLKDERQLDYFVVEMGAYIPGEIARICALARPQISLVTAVGPQHLERFGTLDAVVEAKAEILAALPPDGVAILNGDDARVRGMADRVPGRQVILVSREELAEAGLLARNVSESLDGLSFDVVDTASGEERHFQAPLYGLHNVNNLLLATAAARYVGLSLAEIGMRVASLEPFEHRLQRKVQPGGLTILDDAYSANPVGAQSALHVLGLHKKGKRILITPGMVELGSLQASENRKLGALATEVATDIVLVGIEQTRPIYEGVVSTGFNQQRLYVFDTHAESVAWLREHGRAGDTVLFLNDLPDTYL